MKQKNTFGDYQNTIHIENFHPINSIESTAPKPRKIVFHIQGEYEIVVEKGAQSYVAIPAENFGL